jgi:hypothetical protein
VLRRSIESARVFGMWLFADLGRPFPSTCNRLHNFSICKGFPQCKLLNLQGGVALMSAVTNVLLSTRGNPAKVDVREGCMRRPQSARNAFAWLCKLSFAVLILCSTSFATTVTYDLKNDWGTTNPNGPWSFLQGTTLLPYQSPCDAYVYNCPNTDLYLPLWARVPASAVSNEPYFEPGDILTHSVDGFNGDPTLGESTLKWTAPAAGSIDISGDIWFAHTGLTEIRSNDFFLSLDGSLLTSGTISGSGPYFRPTPFSFSFTGDRLNAGDTLTLVVQRTLGEDSGAGSEDGVNLTITETPATSQTPEPDSLLLFGTGLIGPLGLLRRRLLA